MKILVKKITCLVLLINLVFIPLPASTASDEDFDPNFLISDEELQNWQSMTRDDIQAFLEEQKGTLARHRDTDVEGIIRTASDIIYRAAQEHKINPKYLLVKLQKEQSLITDKNPSQKQIDWATGYAVCDSCKTTDDSIQSNKGFGKQVDSAAGIMRWYFNNLQTSPWIKRNSVSYSIDGITVRPLTLATGFLYTYTPHIHGNKNFWILWQRWFEQIYPDGTLLKSTTDPTVYLVKNGQKRPFASYSSLATRFDPKLILTVPAVELNHYKPGPTISLPNYAILKNNNQYYLLDNDTVRPFASFTVVRELGYNPDEIIEVETDEISFHTVGEKIGNTDSSPLGRVVKIKENNSLYYLNGEKFHPITDAQIAKINFPHLSIETAVALELQNLTQASPILFKDGTIVGVEGENKIFVIENGKKRHIATEQAFVGLGYSWSNVLWTDQFTGLNHPTGVPIYLRKDVQVADVSGKIDESTGTIQTSETPVITESVSKMIRTPDSDKKIIGNEFTTEINTYLVADQETGEVLAGKNIDDIRPMASFTKVMAAHQLFTEGLNTAAATTYEPNLHKSLYHRFRIAAGESILNKDLLDSMMVSSLNTATQMLVYKVGKGDLEGFVKKMNEQIKNWGLDKTNFVDTTGERLGNVTTAREYLTLYQKATEDVNLRQAMNKAYYEYNELKDLDGKPKHFDNHTNQLITKQNNLPFNILTSKTGYLDESGAGLAMEIQRKIDNKKFIVIMMGNPDYSNRFTEFERLSTWATNSL